MDYFAAMERADRAYHDVAVRRCNYCGRHLRDVSDSGDRDLSCSGGDDGGD